MAVTARPQRIQVRRRLLMRCSPRRTLRVLMSLVDAAATNRDDRTERLEIRAPACVDESLSSVKPRSHEGQVYQNWYTSQAFGLDFLAQSKKFDGEALAGAVGPQHARTCRGLG